MPTDSLAVLFVITRGDSIGGGQIHVRDLARALQARGHRVAVATGSVGALQAELDQTGIPHFLIPGLVRSVNPLSDLVAIAALRRRIRAFRPGLVSCHTAKAGLVGRLAALWERIPVVFTAHGWQFAEGISVWQKCLVLGVEAILARLTRRIVTVSDYDRELALRYRLGSPRKVVLIHNGMPWRAGPPPRSSESKSVQIVMVARFQQQKDHATLFQALEKWESEPWTLELIGDGPDLTRWSRWVDQRGWSGRVKFSGQVLDVPQRLESSDLFVLASRWEGFPRSILEAMRAELPVIASDVGGVREAVIDQVTGFLVPPCDPQALAGRIGQLLASSADRQRMGKAGRQRYEQEFTFDGMLSRTLQVWEQISRRAH